MPALVVASLVGIVVPPAPPIAAEPSFGATSGRPFAANSAWNTPIGSAPAVDPRSSAQVGYLAGFTHPGSANLYAYGVPVWDANANTPRYTVPCTQPWGTCPFAGKLVPIPDGAFASSGTDKAMVIIDWSTQKQFEFYQYAWNNGSPTIGWGAVGPYNAEGRDTEPGRVGNSTGAGISRLAGVVRTFEIAQRSINHALVFSTTNACASTFRYPAAKTDGRSTRSDCLPEGARLQLSPSVDVDALSISPAEKMVARALQTYGAYVIDNGGAPMAFIFETPSGEADPYCSVGLCSDYTGLDGIPWNQMRVLASWNDPTDPTDPGLSVAKTTVREPDSGTADAAMQVTLSEPSTSSIAVNYSTAPGSAAADVDYVTSSGTIVIPAGATTGTIVVPVYGDTLYESDEYFTVTVSSNDAPVSVASARVVLEDDDPKPTVAVVSEMTWEGDSGTRSMTFTALLSEVAGVACRLTFTTADATADARRDYEATTERITVEAGSLTTTFTVSLFGDRIPEQHEIFVVTLTSPTGCARENDVALGAILNDD